MWQHLIKGCLNHPELAAYSEKERHRLIDLARSRRGEAMWIVPLGIISIVGATAVVTTVVAAKWVHSVKTANGSFHPFWADPSTRLLFMWMLLLLGPAAVVTWIVARRELVMRSVLRHMVKARCPYCLFSLEGLVIRDGAVRCPECGQQVVLAEEGIHPDDLIPERSRYAMLRRPKPVSKELETLPLAPEAPAGKKKRIRPLGQGGGQGWGQA